MANKKKLNLASTQANKLIAELPERREKISTQVQFRTEILESQKRVSYQNEFDRLRGAKRLAGLHPNVNYRIKEFQQKNKTFAKRWASPCYS